MVKSGARYEVHRVPSPREDSSWVVSDRTGTDVFRRDQFLLIVCF